MANGRSVRPESSDLGLLLRTAAFAGVVAVGVGSYSLLTKDAKATTGSSGETARSNQTVQQARPRVVSMEAFSKVAMKVAALESRQRTLEAENSRLKAEINGLVGSNGVLPQVIGHIRRLDGQGQALRSEIAIAFGVIDGDRFDDERVAVASDPIRRGARHQIVTKAAGALPPVTARITDPVVPKMRPEPTIKAKAVE